MPERGVKLKICGVCRAEDAEYANEAMPDYAGFIFKKGSKRYVSPETAEELTRRVDRAITRVGVFGDDMLDTVLDLYSRGIIQTAQLHGEARAMSHKLVGVLPVIVAVSVAPGWGNSFPADYLLLDHGAGGTGERFDWGLIGEPALPWFLAGGLDISNLRDALRLNPYAVDICSGTETDGKKDRGKVLQIAEIVRRYNGR